MINLYIEELAKIYGIEVDDVEPGHGGLFYGDDGDKKIELRDILELSRYATLVCDHVSLKDCNIYSTYSEMVGLMSNAA